MVGHTVVFVEHDPTLYNEAFNLVDIISGTLKDLARDAFVIHYTSQVDRSFLARAKDIMVGSYRVAWLCRTAGRSSATNAPKKNQFNR